VDCGAAVIKTPLMGNPTQKFAAQLLFASNMKRIRLEKKLTQENVALSIANIERIACALGVGMPELLTEPERAQRKSGSKA